MLSEELKYQLLRRLEENPEASQRELAKHLGLSLGKTNYCIKSLVEKGWVKARNFKNNKNKAAYMYVLTPKGMTAKAKVTRRFLDRKVKEYEQLERQIEELRAEVQNADGSEVLPIT